MSPRLRFLVFCAFAVLLVLPLLPILATPPLSTPVGASTAVAPAFQAVGLFGDLAIVNPSALLSVATFIAPDQGFAFVSFANGLARNPVTGQVFVVGTDFVDSYLGRLDFKSGAETTVGVIPGEIVVDLAFDGAGQLYGLTDDANGTTLHALLRIDQGNASATLAKVLDPHGGSSGSFQLGAIAWNPADQSLYYADLNGDSPRRHLFIDKLTPGTFAQTPGFTASFGASPYAMAFAEGRLWLSTNIFLYSADAGNLAGGLTNEGAPSFPSADGELIYQASGMFPAALSCIRSPTAACLADRFKVEVSYDATPQNGSGPGKVVLESAASVKFTFFSIRGTWSSS